MTSEGTYYVHVIDDAGYIAHSLLKYVSNFAYINLYVYNDSEQGNFSVDTYMVSANQSLYSALNNSSYWETEWESDTDIFNGDTIYVLTNILDYPSNINVKTWTDNDGNACSSDWKWIYTVGNNRQTPEFDGEEYHYKSWNQYIIQPGDKIDVVYTLVESVEYGPWEATYKWYE